MPNRDGTGPEGMGPLTGRGLGPCGRGLARGRGFGRGRFCRFLPTTLPARDIPETPLSEKEEKAILAEELKEIEMEKKEIEKRLKELKD